jgi:cobalamin biosynthesis Mg chelatase CobN
VQGLLAAGVSPSSLHRGGAVSPVEYLRSLIAPDGHIRYSLGSDQTPVWVTAEALMALDGKPLPLAAVPARPHPSQTGSGSSSGGSSGAAGGGSGSKSGRRSGTSAASTHSRPHAKNPSKMGHSKGGARTASTSAGADSKPLSLYAAGAGLLTALALAPVGLG